MTAKASVSTEVSAPAAPAAASADAPAEAATKDFAELDPNGGYLNASETLLLSKITCTPESLTMCQKDRPSVTSTHKYIRNFLWSSDVNALAAWYESRSEAVIDCSADASNCLRDIDLIKQRIEDEQTNWTLIFIIVIILLLLI